MRTVRRLYFYAVALISLEVVIWGVISLARNAFNLAPGASASILASGLALALVGLPIFLLHWRTVEREAYRDDDERASRVRAVFLYGVLLALLIPVVQSVLAILDRLFLIGLGLNPASALIGGKQNTVDNLIAIVTNLAALAYFFRILQRDWWAKTPGYQLADVRRLYRYVWMLYSLVLLVVGVRETLFFSLYTATQGGRLADSWLGNGLALLVVGTPLWAWNWLAIQRSLTEPEEKNSILRLAVLYLLALSGAITALASAGQVLQALLNLVLGISTGWRAFFYAQTGTLADIVPAALVWAYFGSQLSQDLEGLPDEPRRAGLRRVYYYLLALLGNIAVFAGVQQALSFVVHVLVRGDQPLSVISGALASLAVGLPLWLVTWTRMQTEAARSDTAGDHARRSVIRKGYLYLVLFALVVGAMVSAGWLLYRVFTYLLGTPSSTFVLDTSNLFQTLVLVLIWLFYHLRALRADGRLAQRWLGNQHAAFPAVILQADNESFTIELVQALQRLIPRLPIAVHRMEMGAPGEDLLEAKVVVLPAWLAMQPGEALRLWLNEFPGQRILVPRSLQGWIWLGALPKDERELARETAQAVRQLAEGQEVRTAAPNSPWAVVAYILGGIFGLALLLIILGIVISALQ